VYSILIVLTNFKQFIYGKDKVESFFSE
jgi:hypothetical protein